MLLRQRDDGIVVRGEWRWDVNAIFMCVEEQQREDGGEGRRRAACPPPRFDPADASGSESLVWPRVEIQIHCVGSGVFTHVECDASV